MNIQIEMQRNFFIFPNVDYSKCLVTKGGMVISLHMLPDC